MSEPAAGSSARGGWAKRISVALLLALLAALFASTVAATQARADEPKVPEDVAAYFATGLVPRLADLYGSPGNTDPASTFDETTKVGTIHRLLAWTPDFLAGQKTDAPTQLTNTWIAPVTAKEGTILGLAAVWINPGSNIVELADFSRGRALVDALGRAPKDTRLIDDTTQQAWFATDGKTLTPLVVGSSGTHGPLTPVEYQKILVAKASPAKAQEPVANPGLVIAGITLGAVVLLLAVFILLPGRRRKTEASRDTVARPRRNPRQEDDRAFDREASRTEARAVSRARAAVSAEAGLVDAMATASAHPAVPLTAVPAPEPGAAPEPEAASAAPKPPAKKKTASAAKRPTPKPYTARKPSTAMSTTTTSAPAKPAGATKPSTEKSSAVKRPSTTKRPTTAPSPKKPASETPLAKKPTPEKPSAK